MDNFPKAPAKHVKAFVSNLIIFSLFLIKINLSIFLINSNLWILLRKYCSIHQILG